MLNDWHLKDVPAHRVFGDILQQYRTDNPSRKLRSERAALGALERMGGRYSDPNEHVKELTGAGFTDVQVECRDYRIRLPGVRSFLDMRLKRVALKHELLELSRVRRAKLLDELRKGLKQFVRNGRFILDWKVTYVKAKKPN